MTGPIYIDIQLPKHEFDALMDWHRDRMYQAAEKQEYADAESHQRRLRELTAILANAQGKEVGGG